jgi:hypothetical protein
MPKEAHNGKEKRLGAGTRTAQITMIRVWLNIMSPADVRTAWGIPLDRFTALGTLD